MRAACIPKDSWKPLRRGMVTGSPLSRSYQGRSEQLTVNGEQKIHEFRNFNNCGSAQGTGRERIFGARPYKCVFGCYCKKRRGDSRLPRSVGGFGAGGGKG